MIAILSDIHGNLPALNAVLEKIDALGIERIISLGDITGYYAQPGECIDLLRDRKAIQLLGNHDKYIVDNVDCPRSKTVSTLLEYQRTVLSSEQVEYLASLKPIYEEGSSSFVHGGWRDNLDEYIYKVSKNILPKEGKFFFSGHTHVQICANLDSKVYCNPGSVGQPRDGNPKSAFAVFSNDQIELHRVDYDIEETVNQMRMAGFKDERLWSNLYLGAQIGGRVDQVDVIASEDF